MPEVLVFEVIIEQPSGARKVLKYTSGNISRALTQGNTDAAAMIPPGEVIFVKREAKIDKDAP